MWGEDSGNLPKTFQSQQTLAGIFPEKFQIFCILKPLKLTDFEPSLIMKVSNRKRKLIVMILEWVTNLKKVARLLSCAISLIVSLIIGQIFTHLSSQIHFLPLSFVVSFVGLKTCTQLVIMNRKLILQPYPTPSASFLRRIYTMHYNK